MKLDKSEFVRMLKLSIKQTCKRDNISKEFNLEFQSEQGSYIFSINQVKYWIRNNYFIWTSLCTSIFYLHLTVEDNREQQSSMNPLFILMRCNW